MRILLRTCTLLICFSSLVVAQDLAQLQKTVEEKTPAKLPDDLGRKRPSDELVENCKSMLQTINQIYAIPDLDENHRDWALRREAIALIVLAYVETPAYYPRLAVVSDELVKQKNSTLAQEAEKHVLKIGSALAVASKPAGNVGINLKSLAERMVLYAEQYPGQEARTLIDQLLLMVRAMNTVARDRRLAVIAPIFQRYYQSINHLDRAQALIPDVMRTTLPGQPMMLMGVDLEGNELDLTSLRDKVVLLQFWGTWCPHCKEEIPGLIELYEKYHDSGLEIIGVNTAVQGDNERKVKQFVEGATFGGKKIPWTILHEGLGKRQNKMTMTEFYGIKELPVLILVGRNGNVRNLHPLPSTLDSLIAEATSPLASIEFTEEEKKQIEEIKKKQATELKQQIQSELSAP